MSSERELGTGSQETQPPARPSECACDTRVYMYFNLMYVFHILRPLKSDCIIYSSVSWQCFVFVAVHKIMVYHNLLYLRFSEIQYFAQ